MHQIIKTLLISFLIGLAFGSYLYFYYDHRPVRILISVLSCVSIGSLMMLAINYRHYFTNITALPGLKVVIIIGFLIIAALAGSEFTLLISSVLQSDQKYKWFNGGSIYMLNGLIVLITGIPIYVSEEWKNMLQSRISSQQYRLLQLEQQQTLFQLELLRAKINPHFLYNVHNTIAGLISKDPHKAEEMIILLSKFFRFTLNKNSADFHRVADEIEIITTYLHMQHIRYDQRMTYTIQADPGTLNLQIASFVLQPLVENAVKHGIETSAANGFIAIKITLNDKNISIKIADSGSDFSDKPGTGMGLQMVMNKLQLLYSTDFELEFNNTPEKYVRLTIPKRN
ncbi:sensor histidine kinase YesM [Pedobacter cryoconitis]|uniref:Sensor histidine kinase YesM n=1 Tax=Pedobacter cryoconitis TaxID=188932 RepID=A0A7W8ZRM1_9SPHI|nr:histidine kinase [Pedobacter cryoconitis]MBB5638773.1 sensor histidine kinase YesM [Pedobacter cryoconitis]MBB6270217.1 sensor histidine kinase YesM [Pedobacter cryoconitis]